MAGRRIACAELDAGGDAVVILCHGFRGERTGPNRTFTTTARALGAAGVSSLRFDQYGSGDSDGAFQESRFDDWVRLIRVLAQRELDRGRAVALLGQSMGASAAICAASDLALSALAAWVPDASTDPFVPSPEGWTEEGGQRVDDDYWRQAHAADVPGRLAAVRAPRLLVFGTADAYVSTANREALTAVLGPDDELDVHEGWPHSAWTAAQAAQVVDRTVRFLVRHLRDAA